MEKMALWGIREEELTGFTDWSEMEQVSALITA